MRQLARRDPDRNVLPRPRPSVARDPANGTRGPARAVGGPSAASLFEHDGPNDVMALQHAAGNLAVARLMRASATVQRHPGPTMNQEVEDQPESEASTVEAGPSRETEAAEDSEAASVKSAAPAGAEGTSQPGTGTTGRSGFGLTGDARKKAIEDACRASATGMWAMSIIEKWKIPVDYEYGGQGSFHQGGKIYVNKTKGIGAAALTLMHEAQHADTYKSGKQANAEKLDRAEYIKRSIADEAEAVVRQIEGLAVTKSLGIDMSGAAISDSLKARYLKAFYAKRDALKKANPEMSTGEINRICRTTARDEEVTKWFYDGTFVTSTDNNSYAIFYGKQWDEVHKTPGKK
jgi:hypothetical protein